MNSFWRDVRFGTRLLLRDPGFTAAAVMAFALGIAANTAIFSVVYATLLAPLPYPEPDQLVMVWSRIQGAASTVFSGYNAAAPRWAMTSGRSGLQASSEGNGGSRMGPDATRTGAGRRVLARFAPAVR